MTEETSPETGGAVDELIDRVQRTTCTGDIRDFLLDRLKHDKEVLPWNMLGEDKQRDLIASATSAAERLIARVVRIVAADGRNTISATLEQFTAKDGVKAVLKLPSDDETMLALNHSRGSTLLIVIADDAPYLGERKGAQPDPDQPPLFDRTAAGRDDDQAEAAD